MPSPVRSVGESPGSLEAHRGDRRTAGFAPRPFALYGVDELLIAWGMTLPDGSAVVVDWNLPRAGGRDILAHHASDPRCANTPVVVLAQPDLMTRIPTLCVAEILLKPVKPATLVDVLGRALAAVAPPPMRHETSPNAA